MRTARPETPRLSWCGESYVTIRLFTDIDIWSVAGVLRLQQQLAESDIARTIIAMVPGWTTLLLWLDADIADPGAVEQTIAGAASAGAGREIEFESRVVTLPTVYGGEAGPDLEFVAGVNGLSADDTVERLQATQFAGMVSFSPGMANCMWMDSSRALTAPKYDSPRTTTPPGTVGLGGSSISLYSVATPGGFQMVGRLAVPIYQPRPTLPAFEDSPTLLRPGDRIILRAVGLDDLAAISEQVAHGTYRYAIESGSCRVADGELTWT
jgi:KipI family sensor histidine kinase inhibitor